MSINMDQALKIEKLNKIYDNGFQALNNINLEITPGEIFALLGPNGAGKTTLISTICGLVRPSSGNIQVFGHDHIKDYKIARTHIGLVPQELTTDSFETVLHTVKFSRGLFGKPPSPSYIETILKQLSLWDKKDSQIRTLSGGMKRRLLIAKAMVHQPPILILDEPTAGVSPIVMDELFDHIIKVKKTNVAILMVEQNAKQALNISDRGYVLVTGENRYSGTGKELLNDPRVRSSFLGA